MAYGVPKWHEKRQRYFADFKDGDGGRHVVYGKTQKECLRKLRDKELAVEEGRYGAKDVRLSDAFDAYITNCERLHKANGKPTGRTIVGYRSVYENHARRPLGKIKLNDPALRNQCQDVLNALLDRGLKSTWLVKVVLNLTAKYAVQEGMIKRSPFADNPLRAPRFRPRDDMPTVEQVRNMYAALGCQPGEHYRTWVNRRAIMLLGIHYGARSGEVAGLQWENIDFVSGRINIEHSRSPYDDLKSTKTPAGVRSLEMLPEVRMALEAVAKMNGRPGTGPVFIGRSGKPVSSKAVWASYFVPTMRYAGLVKGEKRTPICRFHSLRSFVVTKALDAGCDLKEIGAAVGHSKATMTMHYVKYRRDPEKHRQVIGTVGRLLNPEPPKPPGPPRLQLICDNPELDVEKWRKCEDVEVS